MNETYMCLVEQERPGAPLDRMMRRQHQERVDAFYFEQRRMVADAAAWESRRLDRKHDLRN